MLWMLSSTPCHPFVGLMMEASVCKLLFIISEVNPQSWVVAIVMFSLLLYVGRRSITLYHDVKTWCLQVIWKTFCSVISLIYSSFTYVTYFLILCSFIYFRTAYKISVYFLALYQYAHLCLQSIFLFFISYNNQFDLINVPRSFEEVMHTLFDGKSRYKSTAFKLPCDIFKIVFLRLVLCYNKSKLCVTSGQFTVLFSVYLVQQLRQPSPTTHAIPIVMKNYNWKIHTDPQNIWQYYLLWKTSIIYCLKLI